MLFMSIQILSQKHIDYSLCIKGYLKQTIKGYRQAINYLCKFANASEIEVSKLGQKTPQKLTKQESMHILEVIDNYLYQSNFLRFGNYVLFATLMFEGGCDIYSLSRMMGHSDIKTTAVYLAASAEHLREQMLKQPLN